MAAGPLGLRCAYCGRTNPTPVGSPAEIEALDLAPALERLAAEVPDAAPVHATCGSCGAGFDFPAGEHAGPCPFCGTPVVVDPGEHRRVRPGAVLPFLVGEAEAGRLAGEWLRRLWFAPSGMAAGPGRPRGVYLPYWAFDAATRTTYAGRRGDIVHESTRTVAGGGQRAGTVARVRWTPVRGRVARDFAGVLVPAGETLPRHLGERSGSLEAGGLEPYAAERLAGFASELYRIPLGPAFVEAKGIMREAVLGDVRVDIGGERQAVDRAEVEFGRVRYRLVLLPAWIATFGALGRRHRVVVDGSTGEVRGGRPWSARKLAVAVLAALVLVLVVAGLLAVLPEAQRALRGY